MRPSSCSADRAVNPSGLRGPSTQALTLFGGVRLIAWRRSQLLELDREKKNVPKRETDRQGQREIADTLSLSFFVVVLACA